MQSSLGVINCVSTIVIGSMTVRTDNTVKYKCHKLSSAAYIIVTGPATIRIGSAVKYKCKCNTFSNAVHTVLFPIPYITVELYIRTYLR